MSFRPATPLTEPEGFSTGFARIVAIPHAHTLTLKVQRPENEIHAALTKGECAQLAALLLRYLES